MSEFASYLPHIDVEDGLRRVGGNRGLFSRLLAMCQNSGEYEKLEQALAAGELVQAGDIAHAVKGMTGNLSMTTLFNTSAELCESLRGNVRDEALLSAYRSALEETMALIPGLTAQLQG